MGITGQKIWGKKKWSRKRKTENKYINQNLNLKFAT